ncbi:lasso peptide biosynthesis B2 protein [Oceanobacillus piezotolerans]|uniref:Lasso peptide biosynthesis B2 protein n=1 Tax=Oceanobacillus piezotolerans TaxID=2448030 RepID=A0A498DBD4_9BACI|nr:lasso peptide biosynthesis B2 protein [Oceanobacillus piezotolerans]RLL42777.1 lasso peptide biosynthesis B2 protein [Oceanobacillus piezotolerans]
MRKIKLLLMMDNRIKMLLLESYIYLAWARILKLFPFSKVAPTLGENMIETSTHVESAHRKTLAEISQAIHTMSKYTFWESECLVKAIAALKMLEKRKIESTLYLGTAKDENGKLIAHAWLRSGPFYVTGAAGRERFTVVSIFARNV